MKTREEQITQYKQKPFYPWECVTCHAGPGESCVTPGGKRTDTHTKRYRKP